MDSTEVQNNPNPRETAGILSIMFFGFTIPTFRTGMKKQIGVEDVYNTLRSDRSEYLGDRLEKNWNRELELVKQNKKEKPSLFKAVVRTFWLEYLLIGIIAAVSDIGIRSFQPSMLGGVLDYYTPGSKKSKLEAYFYGSGMVIMSLTSSILMNQYMTNAAHAGMKVRSSVCALIYRKATRLSRTALGDTPAGKVVNLLSNDVARFDFASMMIHQLWIGPVSTIPVIYFLYQRAQLPGIAGILVILIMSPLQATSAKLATKFRKMTALRTDERIRLMDEVILGIQVIKMYAWEIPFQKVIGLARKAEIKIIKKNSYIRALFMTLGMVTTKLALFATLVTITLTGGEITAAKVFVLISYFNMLSMTLTGILTRGIAEIAEMFTSIARLQKFLENDEYKYDQNKISSDPNENSKSMLSLKNIYAKWDASLSDCVLNDITLELNKGKLLGVIGPVGAGKSSLLQTLLGELDIDKGSINANGTYSYASQEPWIFSSTIRQNILFGADYDRKRYKEVIRVCALERDLEQFKDRDMTVVGDKGASLSGGQKARINLARAVYREKDIYLLDDPLSAVDIHVSKVLYDECINGFLKNKTRVLVTHQVHYLKNASHIIILNNGRIEGEGSFNDLANSDNLYAQLLTKEPEITEEEKVKQIEFARQVSRQSRKSRKSSMTSIISEKTIVEGLMEDSDEDSEDEENTKKLEMRDMQEESSKGKVLGSLLLRYFRTGANCFNVFLILSLYVLVQVSSSMVDYFLSIWTNIEDERTSASILLESNSSSTLLEDISTTIASNNINSTVVLADFPSTIPSTTLSDAALNTLNTTVKLEPQAWIQFPAWTTEECLYIYGILISISILMTLGRSFSFYSLVMSCSRNLHQILFKGVIYAKMRFFDTNPSGRVLNRFAKDIGSVDESIPRVLLDGGQMILQIFGSLILVGVANPYAIAMALILAIAAFFLRNIYLKTSKNLKRVEGILKSPVFTHLSATLQGLPTIRALRTEKILQAEFDKIQNYHISAGFMNFTCGAAFGISLSMCSNIFIAVLIFSILTFDKAMGLTGGTVGLAVSQASTLTGMIQMAMRMTADISNQMMSVERVLEYEQLPPEPQPKNPKPLPKNWPSSGKIDFQNVKLQYFEGGPTIIKDLSLNVKATEKVGIVGRTGAGKSSLIAALFRLANVEGKIAIDDIDTRDIYLRDLRSKISIIPQDPVLFSGTLRYNLDPFEEYSDEQLYKVLDEVELKDPNNIINRLENRVMDRGSNYSVGQRQLICLARAIIRNNRILMLDEATANVDPQTDALIQKTIRTKFANCTVLTVAHRLNTIMDSDKVLVMDQGTAAEFDHPHLLLQNSNGIFSKMVEDTGPGTCEQLKTVAKNTFDKNLLIEE
ncbi:ATP-binding cassette sub-family C member 4 [Diabrotica virgifera virgifera]|uniref:Probable multidrug resistance-associated protein lethal(2)03659 n=1 Tax=Diabrotica virgifera virgifera TaxID=50390 RepID=A0A6P7G8U0_DIAVI|nr:ATP-binding cassette sub-family C member 4 [Diabrotica virgifera virgifera]KAI2474192.1 ATP binding cassette (ABC) transporter subfamily C member [Diabrotica virgifera virgifera]